MEIDFEKNNGLVPVIVQDATTLKVLMMAYMNEEALRLTKETGNMTFYSRSRKKLWTKGESSGNYIRFVDIQTDCDGDTLLAKGIPEGPACHTGADTCWNEVNRKESGSFISTLETIIEARKKADPASSYTARLFDEGIKKIAQKVGEESVELILESGSGRDDLFLEEAADLLYHLLVLLHAKDFDLGDIISVLESRHKS
ncbi:MAG: bifunctional phosphoribosyl-AMP cyclohydrolase/phosphoribosyl-ATP diphosphatase HisIE [Bacteroidales bacterium]|jgi:phosphoribosyl-ATP pyrophosphohydrolase/phosphoribosyl-AMP cyclohydrolase|nr:bifunctional phosphoribosyl-AMP cyclohydrolase/phosphoribosyl-ATP diphosphatase HisIE [Bacteroidales bacterium]